MLQQIKKHKEGFTIIEVLIVLAIAGLMMVVVFIAVPNLQRNARNNKIETEANQLVTAYTEVSNQKGGQKLSTATDITSIKNAANLDTNSSIQTVAINVGAGSVAATDDVTMAKFFTSAKCDTDITNGKAIAGTSRQVALIYSVEASGSTTGVRQCVNV